MKIPAINHLADKVATVPKKLKRAAMIAAVTIPAMTATQSCDPCFYVPFFCPPPPLYPAPVMPYSPYLYPGPYTPPPHPCPFCNTKSFDEAVKEMPV